MIITSVHNPANEIVSLDGSDTSLRTDAAGNMTRIPNPKAGIVRADYSSVFCVTRRFAAPRRVEPESLNLTYDAWNRLVRVTTPAGNLVAEYRYDGLNRRVLKTTSCETRRFYYNRNWQCVQETVEDQPTTHYTWGLRYVDDLVCRHTDTTPIYSLADANWNVAALTDAAGTPVERYTYTAFGKLNIYDDAFTPRSASNYNWTRTFTGQVLDQETELMLYRNRYYAPTLGRFITRDPMGYRGKDWNVYRYVKSNTPTSSDILGLQSDCSCKTMLKKAILDLNLEKNSSFRGCIDNLQCLPNCNVKIHKNGKRDVFSPDALAYTYSERGQTYTGICISEASVARLDQNEKDRAQILFNGLLMHEITHLYQYANRNPLSCKNGPRFKDRMSSGSLRCGVCKERERQAYEQQWNVIASYYGVFDEDKELFIQVGQFLSCQNYCYRHQLQLPQRTGTDLLIDGRIGTWLSFFGLEPL